MAEKLEIIVGAKDQFSSTFKKLSSHLPSIKTLAVGASAAIAGLSTAIIAMTKSTAQAYDQVQKFSDRIGISTEALSAYHHIADRSGISIQTLNMGLQRMTRRIGEASYGTGIAVEALRELRIPIEDIQNLKPDKQFELIASRLVEIENPSQRAAMAMKFFDSEGVALLQTLAGGIKGLKDMKEEAEAFGLIVSSQAGKNAAAFNDSLTRLSGSVRGLKNTFAEQLFPIITEVANRLAIFIAKNRDIIVLKTREWLQEVAEMLIAVGKALQWIDNNITDKILDFFFGKSEISKLGAMQEVLKNLEHQLWKMNVEAETGAMVDQNRLQLLRDKIELQKQEIENLRQRSQLEIEEPTIPDISKLFQFPAAEPAKIAEKIEQSRGMTEEWYEWLHNAHVDYVYGWKELEQEIVNAASENAQTAARSTAEGVSQSFTSLHQISSAFGNKAFKLTKSFAIAEAMMRAYQAFNVNLAAYAYPLGPILAALALASGLAQVAKISAMQPAGQAHAGLSNVPATGTYLLSANERIIAPEQNRDLTEFLKSGAGTSIENLTLNIIAPAPLQDMTADDWSEMVEDNILPAMSRLATKGISV